MTTKEYLEKILAQQTFDDDEQEMKDLRARRQEIATTLRDAFPDSAISIRWAGAMAKGTMIRESYDGDMTCYFNHDDEKGGKTLEDIYDNVAAKLNEDYSVDRKASALRVREKSFKSDDFHIDVVPGRFTDKEKEDVYLHRTTGDKSRLKTNLDVHIGHIKDSGAIDAIRLMKLWKVRNGLEPITKTFVLELLVIKLLEKKKTAALADRLKHVWTEFRDNSANLSVEDPANPHGNDLKPALDACRALLSSVAKDTLWQIENSGWEAVFGKVEEENDEESKSAALISVASRVQTRTAPWSLP